MMCIKKGVVRATPWSKLTPPLPSSPFPITWRRRKAWIVIKNSTRQSTKRRVLSYRSYYKPLSLCYIRQPNTSITIVEIKERVGVGLWLSGTFTDLWKVVKYSCYDNSGRPMEGRGYEVAITSFRLNWKQLFYRYVLWLITFQWTTSLPYWVLLFKRQIPKTVYLFYISICTDFRDCRRKWLNLPHNYAVGVYILWNTFLHSSNINRI